MTTEQEHAAPVYDFVEPGELWTEIFPGLYQGGTHDDDTLIDVYDLNEKRSITKSHFDTVVTLYAWAAPVDWLVEELRVCVYDWNVDHIDRDMLTSAVTLAYARWKAGKMVLIRCQAGINRSGLITALVLMLDGMTADDAITLLRERRSPSVLMNADFDAWLRSSDAETFISGLRRKVA